MRNLFCPPFNYSDFIEVKSIKKYLYNLRLEKFGNITPELIKIAIFQGSTVYELKNILELFLLNEGFEPIFYISEYNRFYEESLFPSDNIKQFSPDLIYLHVTNKNIMLYPSVSDTKAITDDNIQKEINKYTEIWNGIEKNYSCPVIQNNFEYPFERFLGSYDTLSLNGRVNYICKINAELVEKISSTNNIYLNDINYLSSKIGLDTWFDKIYWYNYKYAVSYDAIPHIAHNITKIISSIYGNSKKILVVDLDNTIWGGEIGDVGVENILVGNDSPESEAYYDMQVYLKYLKSAGIILATCSKNEESIAKEGIIHHSSLLELEDFSSFKANWNSKHINLSQISDELNLSLGHTVFVDDNPVERDVVKSNLSDVEVPDIGDDISNYVSIISGQNYFERKNITNEDLNRTKYYAENSLRKDTASIFDNYHDYLISLEMFANFSKITKNNHQRVFQIINKTNQFNPTTKRYSVAEVERIVDDEKYITLTATLSDNYGDNGLVSVVIIRLEMNQAHIDLWVMSCRVFQRELEFAVFDCVITELQHENIKILNGYYIPTKKNMPVKDIFKTMGFNLISEDHKGCSCWSMNIPSEYLKKSSHISINYSK